MTSDTILALLQRAEFLSFMLSLRLTGCDVVSDFHGKSKRCALKTLDMYPKISEYLQINI